ncbi:carbohydrate-binding module family 43 protein/Glycoside hydrolase family 72 protein [Pisolithus orientalis]|uniref:carbohydrate-binding module family 43 protein/Glycoside hydrolase family 72 protein n=1 Tax=Pisolithus orientalis TaxID=936130 RepID=UPI002223F5C4|nr:carbohydrate-binding module family 43 protein/Glycoside hydrolase family 72 protein [Pisolithus orientalis]KAI6005009.1 carbohydrate-binding module family 43 protein/Glycoside hydrolase family 72 protein [Pisolithus orientalis]
MRSLYRIAAGLTAAALAVSGVHAIQRVSRAGRYLYTADGNRFYIKGVAYQQQGAVVADTSNPFLEPSTYIDSLANGTDCQRDLPYLQQLGVNTIRAYSVDSSLNHDTCMQLFSNAGIYAIIDLSLPVNGSINRDSPAWTTNLLDLYLETVNTFSKYDNVLAYNVGNEVVTAANETGAATFVKAAARDVKAYLNSIQSSALVGYAAIDGDASWIVPLANYLSCDPSGSNSGATAIDLYGLNNYEWCGDSTFEASYAGTEGNFAGYNVPAYFSEFGCITAGTPRPWTEVGAIFSSEMSPEWSGGIAFSYFPASSVQGQFGMVNISSDGSTVTTGQDFDNLKAQYTQASPPNSPSESSAGSTSYPSCPQQNSTFVASTTLPPTPNLSACTCLENNLGCQFTPTTSNYTSILGSLLDYACSLLGQSGGSCNDISANGTSGTYGLVSECDPTVMLSYVMSEYYSATSNNPQSCSFGGNGTVNSNAKSAPTSAASSCLATATGTFVPTLPSGVASTTPTGAGSSSGSGSGKSSGGAPIAAFDARVFFGVGVLVVTSMVSGFMTLA